MKLTKFVVSAVTTAAVVGAMGITYAQMGDNSIKESSTPASNAAVSPDNSSAPVSNSGSSSTYNSGSSDSTMNSDTLAPRADRG
jgi:hypothetical protein